MNILFLCTGNSCRSQMAEGWARQLGRGAFQVQSAGIECHGQNPYAIAAMAEKDVDISVQESTRLKNDMLAVADLVVTVCGHADEHCPVLPESTRREHWPLDDPACASGTGNEVMDVYRASRDDIQQRVADLLKRLRETGYE